MILSYTECSEGIIVNFDFIYLNSVWSFIEISIVDLSFFLLFFHPLSTLSMYNMQSAMRRISNLSNKIFRR